MENWLHVDSLYLNCPGVPGFATPYGSTSVRNRNWLAGLEPSFYTALPERKSSATEFGKKWDSVPDSPQWASSSCLVSR